MMVEILAIRANAFMMLGKMTDIESLLRDIDSLGEVEDQTVMLNVANIRFEVLISTSSLQGYE
jgi:hypothetical protein